MVSVTIILRRVCLGRRRGQRLICRLGSSAPVKSGGNLVSNAIDLQSSAGGFTRLNLSATVPLNVTQASAVTAGFATFGPAGTPVAGLYADLSTATAATINAIRTAFQVQKLLERDARGGTRYTEIIRSHFGVVSPDSRLQRPEYLGGSSVPVNIAPVAQTSASAINGSATTPRIVTGKQIGRAHV